MKRIGLTTTVPVEVILAAGHQPVDLNNIFITSENPIAMIEQAEQRGFPRNLCSWIKGIYSAALISGVDLVVGVSEGDCSNTGALLEVLQEDGVAVREFQFPRKRDPEILRRSIHQFAADLGATPEGIEQVRQELRVIRQNLARLDWLTQEGKATGFENHLWQVSASDFNGDYHQFGLELTEALREIEEREPQKIQVRLGYIGVPPIVTDLYEEIERLGGWVVYNEVQRQFTLADGIDYPLLDAYLRQYTYPYPLEHRLGDIQKQIQERQIDGIIHYTQAFCYRAIEDMIVRNRLDVPVLKLEGDQPGGLDSRSKLRLEAFIDMLKDLRRGRR